MQHSMPYEPFIDMGGLPRYVQFCASSASAIRAAQPGGFNEQAQARFMSISALATLVLIEHGTS
jgi:hypothetical protein